MFVCAFIYNKKNDMLIIINIDIVAICYMAQTHIKRIPVLPPSVVII